VSNSVPGDEGGGLDEQCAATRGECGEAGRSAPCAFKGVLPCPDLASRFDAAEQDADGKPDSPKHADIANDWFSGDVAGKAEGGAPPFVLTGGCSVNNPRTP
jgi:hypothetical protein